MPPLGFKTIDRPFVTFFSFEFVQGHCVKGNRKKIVKSITLVKLALPPTPFMEIVTWNVLTKNNEGWLSPLTLGMPSKLKPRSEYKFCWLRRGVGVKEQEALALLSKKEGWREMSIESQQKFDFFSYDGTPYWLFNMKINDLHPLKCNLQPTTTH